MNGLHVVVIKQPQDRIVSELDKAQARPVFLQRSQRAFRINSVWQLAAAGELVAQYLSARDEILIPTRILTHANTRTSRTGTFLPHYLLLRP